jgi:hypothetical protein
MGNILDALRRSSAAFKLSPWSPSEGAFASCVDEGENSVAGVDDDDDDDDDDDGEE